MAQIAWLQQTVFSFLSLILMCILLFTFRLRSFAPFCSITVHRQLTKVRDARRWPGMRRPAA